MLHDICNEGNILKQINVTLFQLIIHNHLSFDTV
jgi:hypothetical protein